MAKHDALADGDSENTNILVVDDYPETRLALEATLSNPSYNVVTASSGAEALKCILKHDFAVILLDVLMPNMDGFQTATLIRRREISKDVPIIFLTAAGTDLGLIYKAYSVGAVDYLPKPVDPDVVKAKVAVFVDLYRKGQHIRRQERELRAAERRKSDAALRESEALYEATFDEAAVGIAHATTDGHLRRINRRFCEILGRETDEMLSLRLHDVIHSDYPEDVAEIAGALHRLFVGEIGTYRTEKRCAHKKGHVVWVSLTVSALRSADNRPTHLVVVGEDITDRKHAQADQMFLAAASEMLLSSLDCKATLLSVANLAVPRLGDWCAIDLAGEQPDGAMESIVAHVDPRQARLFGETRRGLAKDERSQLAKVLRTGKSEVVAEISDEMLARKVPDTEAFRVLRAAGFKSMVIAPLVVRDGVLGAITLVSSGARRYGAADRSIVEELAHVAAFAVDNARLYRKAQEAISARDEFLSIASHELRTPLTPLQILLQRLVGARPKEPLESVPPERLRDALTRCERQVRRLVGLVDNLLDVTSLSSSQFTLQLERVDLGAVTREVADRFGDELTRSGCELALLVEDRVLGQWDHLRIEQVVTNLLTNAIKYGAGKPIEVSVKRTGEVATLAVRDHGIGIPPENVSRIFDRFERAVSSRAYGGLGLGLFITRQILEAHGGVVRVESDPGVGSVFTVELPLRASLKQEQADARLTAPGGCG